MDDKFKKKYRISSARLQNWDYAGEVAYYITIYTKDWAHYFGEIENRILIYSNVGVVADLIWYEIKNHAKELEVGQFVVMPNHIHGILILHDNNELDNELPKVSAVETKHALSLQSEPKETIGQQRYQNQGKNSISSIIGSYKSAVTKQCNRLGFEFAWQTRFHDHIIRNAQLFATIQNYITNNPLDWENDKFYGNE